MTPVASALRGTAPTVRSLVARRVQEDEEWEEEEWDDDEWEDDAEWDEEGDEEEYDDEEDWDGPAGSGGSGARRRFSLRGDDLGRGLGLGLLAMMPLLVAYEISIGTGTTSGARSVAEAILTTPLKPLGEPTIANVRRSALVVVAALAFLSYAYARRGEERKGLGPRLVRIWLEGIVGAVVLGPVLLAASRAAEPYVGAMVVGATPGPVPTLTRAGFVMGGAAYEEIVFRFGGVSVTWLAARALLGWFGAGPRARFWGSIALSMLGSALLFSAFHLGALTGWLGPGGEPFDAAVFTWRTTAGILLAALFFWRGLGVAAWTHAAFNLSILIGAGPTTTP
ncbi:MAG: hypothetical protein AAF957_06965 [Planctomycetota bacterium]